MADKTQFYSQSQIPGESVVLFCVCVQGIQKGRRSVFRRTSPPCLLEWTLGSSPPSHRRAGRATGALRSCGESTFFVFFLPDDSRTSSGLARVSPAGRLSRRIRRSQSGSPAQVHDPELGELRRGGFRATAGPRLARPGNTR